MLLRTLHIKLSCTVLLCKYSITLTKSKRNYFFMNENIYIFRSFDGFYANASEKAREGLHWMKFLKAFIEGYKIDCLSPILFDIISIKCDLISAVFRLDDICLCTETAHLIFHYIS